jgi:hypothetical protein
VKMSMKVRAYQMIRWIRTSKQKGSQKWSFLMQKTKTGYTRALCLAGILGGTDSKLMGNFMSSCIVQFTGGESKISWIGVDSAANAHIVADKRLREETSTNDYRGSTPRGGNQKQEEPSISASPTSLRSMNSLLTKMANHLSFYRSG